MRSRVLEIEAGIRSFQNQFSAFGHGVACIHCKIHDDLLQLGRIGLDSSDLVRQVGDEFNILSDKDAQHLCHVLDGLVQVEDLRLEYLLAAEGKQLPSQTGCAVSG